MAERQLDIILKVKDLATSGFKQAAQSAKEMHTQMTSADGGALKASSQAFEKLAKFQQLAAGVAVAAQSSQVAFVGIGAAVSAFKGDAEAATAGIEELQSSLTKLPFGIGQIASAGQMLRNVFTGEREELEAINEEIAKAERKLKRMAESNARGQAFTGRSISNIGNLERQTAESGVTGQDLAKLRLDRELKDQREAAAEALAIQQANVRGRKTAVEAGLKAAQDQYEKELAAIAAFEAAKREELAKADAAILKQQTDTAAKLAAEQQKQADRERETAAREAEKLLEAEQREQERQLAEKQRHEERLAQLQSDIRQRTLRANGQVLEAELEQIREGARRQLAAAQGEGERTLIEQQQALQEAEARKRNETKDQSQEQAKRESLGNRAVGSESLGRGFTGIAARFNEGREVAETAKNTKRSADLLEKVATGIERLAAKAGGASNNGQRYLLRI
jgi:hypothetical protein